MKKSLKNFVFKLFGLGSFNLKNRALEVLEQGHLMSLGVADKEGVWVADVIYVFGESLNLYWMSDPEARHSVAIANNSQVAGTITVSNKTGEPNLGLQFSGLAQKIDGPRFDLAVKHLIKRGHEAPSETEDVLDGDSWYGLKLEKLFLIDEENFGFERQAVLGME